MLGAERPIGFCVTKLSRVAEGGRGLQVGDIILCGQRRSLDASQPSDADLLATTIRQYKIGTDVQLDGAARSRAS